MKVSGGWVQWVRQFSWQVWGLEFESLAFMGENNDHKCKMSTS